MMVIRNTAVINEHDRNPFSELLSRSDAKFFARLQLCVFFNFPLEEAAWVRPLMRHRMTFRQ